MGRIGLPANEDYVKIPVTDIQWVAAVRAILYSPVGKSMIRFPMNWLRDRGLELGRCGAIAVVGEAMEADARGRLRDPHRPAQRTGTQRPDLRRTHRERVCCQARRARPESRVVARERQPGQEGVPDTAMARRRQHHRRGEMVWGIVRVAGSVLSEVEQSHGDLERTS